MTTRELAENLGVSVDTITRTANKVLDPSAVLRRVVNGGESRVFTEKQSTLIKQEIQKHHNLASRQIDEVTTEYEENQTIANAIMILQRRNEEYKQRMEKAEAVVNRIADSSGLKTVKEVGDILGYGEKTFFALLRSMKIFFKENGNNLPYRDYINAGYFVVKEKTTEKYGKPFLYTQIFVTAKGELWLEKQTRKQISA